jgi:CubicO group peptidase (beta-lactamase class C family)
MNRLVQLVISALAVGPAMAAPPADVQQRLSRFEQGLVPRVLVSGETPPLQSLAARMAALKVPGVSVAVIHEGRIDWARGYGVTRVNGPPVTEKSLFQAASISKPVFAMAVLHLVDQGKLALDANVNEYLETWKVPDNEFTADQKVTLRRLLSHSAGLTVHGFPGYASGTTVPTTVQVLDGKSPANTAPIRVDLVPGSQLRYSGGGYTVAQLVVADVTGTPVPKLLQDTVLAPLGMTRSTYEQPLPAARAGEVALPYRDDGTAVAGGPHTYPEMAAAGLWTTPSDLATYALGVRDALAGKSKVISAATARAMLTPVIQNQGIGPQLGGGTARKFFMHNGGNEGYRCVLVAYEDGEGAVVMTNGDNGGGLMYEVLHTIAHVYEWPDFAPAVRKVVAIEKPTLDRMLGVYVIEGHEIYVVRRRGQQLVGQLLGNSPATLFPTAPDALFAREEDLVATFALGSDGPAASLRYQINGHERGGTRADEVRSRQVLALIERNERRIESQKADPRSEAAIRKLVTGLTTGKPDYDSMSPQLAALTREQLAGIGGYLASIGSLESLTFERVGDSGADEYLARFANSTLHIHVALDEAGRLEIVNLR